MLPKQDNYKVGIYLRLSKDDERQGDPLNRKPETSPHKLCERTGLVYL